MARKSTRGKAYRKQLATRAARWSARPGQMQGPTTAEAEDSKQTINGCKTVQRGLLVEFLLGDMSDKYDTRDSYSRD